VQQFDFSQFVFVCYLQLATVAALQSAAYSFDTAAPKSAFIAAPNRVFVTAVDLTFGPMLDASRFAASALAAQLGDIAPFKSTTLIATTPAGLSARAGG
jgi:hypothetical protein